MGNSWNILYYLSTKVLCTRVWIWRRRKVLVSYGKFKIWEIWSYRLWYSIQPMFEIQKRRGRCKNCNFLLLLQDVWSKV